MLSNKSFKTLPKIGFVWGHSHLTHDQVLKIKEILNSGANDTVVGEYEQRFAELTGSGYGISFAAGRMAFYTVMKALGIGRGDEVILPGFTCSVMPNAVLRIGATPVFADIGRETFGSKAEEIEKKITSRTRLIVAQHSFGIPCNIRPIVELGKKRNIFVLEDCAITLDSSVDQIKAGDWADAAIFSTDHSKPLNTLIGGFFYTKSRPLYEKVKQISTALPHLDIAHQKRLYEQLIFERKFCTSRYYPLSYFLSYIKALKKRLNLAPDAFLNDDRSRPASAVSNYPYPAKLPSFLAQLGLFELERWSGEKQRRKNLLGRYLGIMQKSRFKGYVPKVYSETNMDIVPLRFVFECPGSEKLLEKMAKFIDINLIWFRSPIICCKEGPESLEYKRGSCPTSEKVGLDIINWPCALPEECEQGVLKFFKDECESQ